MPHVSLGSKLEMIRSEFRTVTAFSCEKLELRDYTRPERKNFSEVSSRFNTISECFMQRDRQTDRQNCYTITTAMQCFACGRAIISSLIVTKLSCYIFPFGQSDRYIFAMK